MTTFHVRPHVGSDKNSGTAFDAAWKTLKTALQRYKPGDTVHVWGGQHPPLLVTRERLTLIGHDAKILGALRPDAQHGMLLRASYVSVSGFEVRGARGAGIASTDAHHITIRGNRVIGNGGHGISAVRADYLVIDGNDVLMNVGSTARNLSRTSGISVFNPRPFAGEDIPRRIKITGNRIEGNGTTAKTDGFGVILDKFARENPTPYYGQSLVADNRIAANWNSGLHLYYADNVDVLRNRFEGNGTDATKKWAAEIGLQSAHNIRIRANVARARRYVFFSGGSERNTVEFSSNDFGPAGALMSPFSGAGQEGPR